MDDAAANQPIKHKPHSAIPHVPPSARATGMRVRGARMVSARRRAADDEIRRLTSALEEKNTLLKELHHRVKNTLQLISSMLHLQAEAVADPELARCLIESQQRVKTMAMIHEKLYQSEDRSRVNFGDYLRTLTTSLVHSYGRTDIAAAIESEDMLLPVNVAIPCGLIVNELVSNAMKYAFPSATPGSLLVHLARSGQGRIELRVADNGVGLPPEIVPAEASTLGLTLVSILVQQLNGTMRLDPAPQGTAFIITFPDDYLPPMTDGRAR